MLPGQAFGVWMPAITWYFSPFPSGRREIHETVQKLEASAAKAHEDLIARVAEVKAAADRTLSDDEIEEHRARLYGEIEAALALKRSKLEAEAVAADNALRRIMELVENGEKALEAWDAKKAAAT
jgi:hypothetical protein